MALALSTGPRSNRRLNGMGGKVGGSAATAVQKECSAACMLSTSCASSALGLGPLCKTTIAMAASACEEMGRGIGGGERERARKGVGEADVNVDPVAKEDIQPRGHAPA
ncbi:hypothetical protein B0H14DRAFT_3444910 [Mycena olivaceomarginata]|nr:hypothetical protein B0H14DRAFT_3444910 [Mycena olivaceomarginata]